MEINLSVFATGESIINNIVRFKAYETTALGVVVEMKESLPTQEFPFNITLTVPNPVPHIVNIFSTPDDSDGVLLTSILYNPTYAKVEIRLPWEILIGGPGPNDPPVNSTEIPLSDVDGWSYYPERRASGGTMSVTEYGLLPGGGIKLTSSSDRFEEGEILFIHFAPKITEAQPVFNYLNVYKGATLIDSSRQIDITYSNQLNQISAISSSITLTVKPITEIPDGSRFAFTTFLSNNCQVTIKCTGSEGFTSYGGVVPAFYLGVNDEFIFVKFDNKFIVEHISPGVFNVGIYKYSDIKVYPNMAYCDGSLLGKGVNYPRVLNHLQKLNPGDVYSSLAARSTAGFAGSARWVYDTLTDEIFLPDARGLTMKSLNENRPGVWRRPGTDRPGSVEDDCNLSHNHVDHPFKYAGAKASDLDSTGTPGSLDNGGATSEYRVGYMQGSGYDLWAQALIESEGEVENVVRNDGRYRLVSI